MANKELFEAVGKYIEKYYIPEHEDIAMDNEKKSIFQKIFGLRAKKYEVNIDDNSDYSIDENASTEFDVSSMQKTKITSGMSMIMPDNRKLDALIDQMEETFTQRLFRMIDEKGMTDSEVYTKAYVDRRHFSKIRKDINYSPNKKTVLALSIALELSVDEAKNLLESAGFTLSRSSKVDIIVTYFLQNRKYDMFEINEILYEYGQQIFE